MVVTAVSPVSMLSRRASPGQKSYPSSSMRWLLTPRVGECVNVGVCHLQRHFLKRRSRENFCSRDHSLRSFQGQPGNRSQRRGKPWSVGGVSAAWRKEGPALQAFLLSEVGEVGWHLTYTPLDTEGYGGAFVPPAYGRPSFFFFPK